MQFHLNGFRAGDPHCLHDIDEIQTASFTAVSSEVDVLIVGAGPAGLLLATQLSLFPDITVRLAEQKSGPLRLGQADGVQCRTIEMFEAFGFSERVLKEAYWVNETTFWKPNAAGDGKIVRSGRIRDTEEGLSEFPHVILNQARIHDFFLETMKAAPTRFEPTYNRSIVDIEKGCPRPGKQEEYPIQVTLECLGTGNKGETETVNCRYVVGCDGARSSVRRSLGLNLEGDSGNQAWGVMDVLAVTDFPDVRFKAIIHSKDQGNILIIPREGGYMVRLYIELDKLAENERIASRNLTSDDLIEAAKRILYPYTLDIKEVPWWSVYEIGQRLCKRFDDVPDDKTGDIYPRIFITGDACHTHSPKAGQGMNVSMGDAYNLGWKLAAVIRGHSSPALLRTYSLERQALAQELIDFDREFARLFSAKPREQGKDGNEDGVDPAEFQRYFQKSGEFTAGVATKYVQSLITAVPGYQHLAKRMIIGMRFHSVQVVRLSDAKPVLLGHCIKADGRWRLFIFNDRADPSGTSTRIVALCKWLANSPDSPVVMYKDAAADVDSVIDVRAVLQQSHASLYIQSLPSLLRPRKGRYKLCDYEKVFCDEPADSKPHQSIYDVRGIDREQGCIIIVRPDQYIASVLPLDGYQELSSFFGSFMLVPQDI